MDGRIERGNVHQVRLSKISGFMRRLHSKRLLPQFIQRLRRMHMKNSACNRAKRSAFENHSAHLDLCRIAICIAREYRLLAIVEPAAREIEDVLGRFFEWRVFKPLNQRGELAIAFENIKRVVIPAILANEAFPASRNRCWHLFSHSRKSFIADSYAAIHRCNFQSVAQSSVFNQILAELTQPDLFPVANGAQIKLALLRNKVHCSFTLPVASFELAYAVERDRSRFFNISKWLAFFGCKHQAQSNVRDVICHRVRAVHGGHGDDAELVVWQSRKLGRESVNRSGVLDFAMSIQLRQTEPQSIWRTLPWLRELRRPHSLQCFAF